MKASDIPERFVIPWADEADPAYIRPVPLDPPVEPGAASLKLGFPPLNFIPVAVGGIPPFGEDMNGMVNQISAWARWQAAGAPTFWDSAFSTAIGGYPQGAMVTADTVGGWYLSIVDDNPTNPNAGGANWMIIRMPTPDILLYFGAM